MKAKDLEKVNNILQEVLELHRGGRMLNDGHKDDIELSLMRVRDAAKNDVVAGNKAAFLLYLQEEVGEVAECIEVEMGMKKRRIKEPLEDECVDVVVAALGNYFNAGGTVDNLCEVLKKKSKKWLDRTQKKKRPYEEKIGKGVSLSFNLKNLDSPYLP